LIPTLSWAKVLKHDVGSAKRDFHELKKVCEVMGLKHNLVVSAKPPSIVDCMAREVFVTDFCLKTSKGKTGLLRGKVDPYSNKVVCEYGQSLSLVFGCSPGKQSYCDSAIKGCERLKNIFAVEHELTHSSILPDVADRKLQCYFSASNNGPTSSEIIPALNLE